MAADMNESDLKNLRELFETFLAYKNTVRPGQIPYLSIYTDGSGVLNIYGKEEVTFDNIEEGISEINGLITSVPASVTYALSRLHKSGLVSIVTSDRNKLLNVLDALGGYSIATSWLRYATKEAWDRAVVQTMKENEWNG